MCSLSKCDTKEDGHDEAVSLIGCSIMAGNFGRHVDAFVRQFGPALNIGAMSLAPALASVGLPQAAATTLFCVKLQMGMRSSAVNCPNDILSKINGLAFSPRLL